MTLPPVRLALTLPGAASLGSFEAGAVAAVVTAVQAVQAAAHGEDRPAPVVIDAVAGSSAGAITGLLAARSLLAGLDPVQLLWRTWVDEASLTQLRGTGLRSPFTLDRLAQRVEELLDRDGASRLAGVVPQESPVRLRVTLCCLQGLRYDLADLGRAEPVPATTYRDWSDFTFTSTVADGAAAGTFAEYTEPAYASALEVALASAANGLGFPPRLLNRRVRPEDCRAILANQVSVPGDGWLWYSDGGTVHNEPLSHAVRLAKILDGERGGPDDGCRRVHVVVHPAPARSAENRSPRGPGPWADAHRRPRWSDALVRVSRISLSQSTYDDLRALAREHSRQRWQTRLCDELGPTLTADQRALLLALLEGIDDDRARARRLTRGRGHGDSSLAGADGTELLRTVVGHISGIRGRCPAHVAVISPDQPPAPDGRRAAVLRGASLGHFGGFLDRDDRASDFLTGFDQAMAWLHQDDGALAELPPTDRCAAEDAARARRPKAPTPAPHRPARAAMRRRLDVARLVGRTAAVVVADRVLGRPRPISPPRPDLACPPNGGRRSELDKEDIRTT